MIFPFQHFKIKTKRLLKFKPNSSFQRDPNIELDVTTKHNSLSFEQSDNEYESTVGVEINRGNIGKSYKFLVETVLRAK